MTFVKNQTVLLALKQKLTACYWAGVFEQAGYATVVYDPAKMDWTRFIQVHTPHILFIEAAFADDRGLELARLARLTYPALRCVVCMPPTMSHYAEATQIDISGYLPEGIDNADEVLHYLNQISQGYRYISPVFRLMSGAFDQQEQIINALSKRRKQILRLLAKGFTARQIGQELKIAESTVRHHKEQIADLIGLKGVYQLKIFVGSVAHLLE